MRGSALRPIGTNVDDFAARTMRVHSLREHLRDDCARGVQQRSRVDVDQKILVGVACFVHRFAHAKTAREVAQCIHPAEAFHNGGDHRRDLRLIE